MRPHLRPLKPAPPSTGPRISTLGARPEPATSRIALPAPAPSRVAPLCRALPPPRPGARAPRPLSGSSASTGRCGGACRFFRVSRTHHSCVSSAGAPAGNYGSSCSGGPASHFDSRSGGEPCPGRARWWVMRNASSSRRPSRPSSNPASCGPSVLHYGFRSRGPRRSGPAGWRCFSESGPASPASLFWSHAGGSPAPRVR